MPARRNRRNVPQGLHSVFTATAPGSGSIVHGRIYAPKEGLTDGKWRPVLIVERLRSDDGWHVMGLTTSSTFRTTDEPRLPLEDWYEAGLGGPGYFWGGALVPLRGDDLFGYIGEITLADAATAEELLRGKVGFLEACAERRRQVA